MPVQGDAKRDMQRHEGFKASRIAEDRSKALKGEGAVDELFGKGDERNIAPRLESEFALRGRRRLAGAIDPFRLAQRCGDWHRLKDVYSQDRRFWVRLYEGGSKQRAIPRHHNSETYPFEPAYVFSMLSRGSSENLHYNRSRYLRTLNARTRDSAARDKTFESCDFNWPDVGYGRHPELFAGNAPAAGEAGGPRREKPKGGCAGNVSQRAFGGAAQQWPANSGVQH